MTASLRSASIAVATTLAAVALALTPGRAAARPGVIAWSKAVGVAGVAAPALLMARDGSGTVYVAETLAQRTASGATISTAELDAYNETTGSPVWRKTLTISSPFTVTGIATLPGLVVISVSSASAGFIVQAYSATTAALSWSSTVAGGHAWAIAAAGSQVVAVGDLGEHFHARAYTSAGVASWQYTDAASISGASAVAIGNGRAVVGGYPGFVLRAFDVASGAVLFTHADASTLGQIYDLALSGTSAYAAGQSITTTPLVRAYDLSTGVKSWDAEISTGSGAAHAIAVAGSSVVTTGAANRTNAGVISADLFTELRTTAGARKWIDQVDAGGYDIGNDIAIQGNRVYVAGDLTNAGGKQDSLMRAYGLDGYVHWQLRATSSSGNRSGAAVATTAKAALWLTYQPAANNAFSALLAAFDATAAGPQDKLEQPCSGGTQGPTVISVASLPGQAFSVCQMPTPQRDTSSVSAWDIQTAALQWTEGPALPDGSPVFVKEIAATPGFVIAVGKSRSEKAFVRAYATASQGTTKPKILWTDVGPASSDALHVAAGGGFVVASMSVNGAQVVKAYDLSVASTNACWSNLGDASLGKPCVKWIDTRPEYTYPGVVTIASGRAALAPSGATINSDVIVYTLSSGAATKFSYPLAPSGSGLPYAVALTKTSVFTLGTGYRGAHTYYAAGYQLATPAALPWYDDADARGTEKTVDGRSLAVVGTTRVYGCGYGLTHPLLRAYVATTGALLWELKPTKWPDLGMCFSVTADPLHVFMGGNDGTGGFGTGNALVASVNAKTGVDEWVVRDSVAGDTWDVERQGDRLVVGQSRALRIYEAVCSVHGVEAACP